MSRIQLANHFKNQAFETIGINPQRMGQQISQQTATGIEQAVNASYAQTEVYFTQHSDYLMPRVHEMRTDLAQYYHSKKPSVRLQYITSTDERVNFQMNGTDLLLRELNIFCTTKTNQRQIMDQLKQLALNNNTTGASIYDLGNIIKSESIAELTGVLKEAENKVTQMKQQEQQAQQQMQQEQLAAAEKAKQMEIQAQSERDDKMVQKDITVAEINAAGRGSGFDINQNMQSDYQDALKDIRSQDQYNEQMSFKREQEINKTRKNQDQLSLEREKIGVEREKIDTALQIARENKNKYDEPKKKD
jgi:hypothetical protein